jgi:hypothetical protein
MGFSLFPREFNASAECFTGEMMGAVAKIDGEAVKFMGAASQIVGAAAEF